jgi:hypothetical protein
MVAYTYASTRWIVKSNTIRGLIFSPSSTRVIFVVKATHVLNDKFCWKKLDHLLHII